MSRSNKLSASPSPFGEDIYEASPGPDRPLTARRSPPAEPSMSPSPAVSTSSDKENRSSRPVDKGKGRAPMGPPPPGIAKRRRTTERDESPTRSRRRRTVEVGEDDEEIDGYDPDQDIEERRALRKGLRELNKTLHENRTEVLAADSTILVDTLRQADNFAGKLKQTSDATIDSRLLVTTADLSYKKTLALVSGDSSQGVDVDEFISKCMSFMRGGGVVEDPEPQAQAASSTQRRRGRAAAAANDDDADADEDGDMLNWEYLGRYACLQHNSRPSVPGFLLGPLSLEKRAKRVVVRKAALKANDFQESRPEVLQASDIHKDENANLTNLCTQISTRLEKLLADAQTAVEEEGDAAMTEEQDLELMDRHSVSPNGLALFKFVVNPRSFGQTIENMFYVSFLIRDGKVGLSTDARGMPYLEPMTPRNALEREQSGALKHQSVLSLDFDMWEELIKLFDIKEPMIKHRAEEEHTNFGKKGWYA